MTSKILGEVLSANEKYAASFGGKGDLALPPARRFAILTCMPARGVREVSVVCPGFAVDCLETLEEIDIENRAAFMLCFVPDLAESGTSGGKSTLCSSDRRALSSTLSVPTGMCNSKVVCSTSLAT